MVFLAALRWQYPQATPWAAAAWLAVATAVVLSYRRQTRDLRRVWRWGLPAIRLLAAAFLAVSVLRPVLVRNRTTSEQGSLLIVLDASVTMGIADNTRTPGQWVAIAAATGRLPGGNHQTDTDATRGDCDRLATLADEIGRARAAVDYARLAGRGADTAAEHLIQAVNDLHTAARDTARRLPAGLKSPPLEKALASLSTEPAKGDRDAWLDRVRSQAATVATAVDSARIASDGKLYQSDAVVRDAAAGLADLSRLQLSAVAAADLTARLPPDIALRVIAAAETIQILDPARPNPTGTVWNHSIISKLAEQIRSSPTAPRAVVLLSDGRHVSGDLSALPALPGNAGNPPVFAVEVAAVSPPRDVSVVSFSAPASVFVNEPATIRASIQGVAEIRKSVDAVFTGGSQGATTRPVTFRDDRPVLLETVVRWNVPGPARVALDVSNLSGEATSLNNHAERWIKVIGRPTRIAVFGEPSNPDRAAAAAAWSNRPGIELLTGDASELATADLVVLFDIDPSALTRSQWQAIRSAVVDRGGTVVWAAGDDDRSAPVAADPLVSSLLGSAALQRPAWVRRPGGRPSYHPISPAGDDRAATAVFARYLPVGPNPGHQTLLAESETGTPILTSRGNGRGKMFALTAAGFAGDSSRFWNELLRTAVDPPYEAADDSIGLDADAITPEPGQSVRVRLRTFSAAVPLLRVTGPGDTVKDLQAKPDHASSDGRFTVVIDPVAEGEYTLQAILADRPIGPVIPLHVHPDPAAGLAELAGDEFSLRRLAESTGGRFLRLDQIDTLPGRIADLPADTTHPVEQPLWDTPSLFGIVAGLFVLEWTLRKIAGLQ